jgi:hypothetical protein
MDLGRVYRPLVWLSSGGGTMSSNDITGDALRTKAPSKAYDAGYDRIFGGKKEVVQTEVDELTKRLELYSDSGDVILGLRAECNYLADEHDIHLYYMAEATIHIEGLYEAACDLLAYIKKNKL